MSHRFQPKIVYQNSLGVDVTILFTYPPRGDHLNESITSIWKDNYTESGVHTRVFKYAIEKFQLNFEMLDFNLKDQVRTMYLDVSKRGSLINLFPEESESEFISVRIMNKSINFERRIYLPDSTQADKFLFDCTLDLERTI